MGRLDLPDIYRDEDYGNNSFEAILRKHCKEISYNIENVVTHFSALDRDDD